MMKEIDWSEAPEGYPIWLEYSSEVASNRGRDGEWVREDEENYWTQRGTYWSKPAEGFYAAHYRPSSQAWNGEGLPPVGTVCEAFRGFHQGWEVVKILDHQTQTAACRQKGSNLLFWCSKFRPIRTPEQIAAEEREKAVQEMHDLVGDIEQVPTWTDALRKLYDNGYRKTGEGK